MPRLLARHLNGLNEIVEVNSSAENCPGVRKFSEFMDGLEIPLPELSKAIKIPLRNLRSLSKDGYICGDSQNNIIAYLRAKATTKEYKTPLQEYMECQHGPAERN